MVGYTEEQVRKMVQEAVAKTERSFGVTFKRLTKERDRLKSENEAIRRDMDVLRHAFQLIKRMSNDGGNI